MLTTITFQTSRQGLHEITDRIQDLVHQAQRDQGLCTLFVQHTSASLTIQENADPSARHDLESWMCRHVPENDPEYTHNTEGPFYSDH